MEKSGIIGRVKPRRGISVAVLATVALVVLAVASWPGEREPEYKGKKLSEWLLAYRDGLTNRVVQEEAAKAVRQIGTNSLPFLVSWMDYEQPKWKDKLRDAMIHV